MNRAWLEARTVSLLPCTDENVLRAGDYVFGKWKERAAERGEPVPSDLSSACKFSSLFVKTVFGGHIEGCFEHQWNVMNGRIVDLGAGATDVLALDDPYRHDVGFFANPDHLDSLASCMPRVRAWVKEFLVDSKG